MSSSYSLLSTFKRRTLSDRPVNSVILPPRTTLITELPPCAKEPFSTIISEEHAAEISAWIDRKTSNYATTNIPYDFQLILLGTRDGFAPQTFWNICNGHSNTVVIARVKGTDEIIWVNDTKRAIFNVEKNYQNKYGPNFGDFRMSSDKSNFTLDDGCYCKNDISLFRYYEKQIRPSLPLYFSIINYEVFKIVRTI
ncbi:hypothetical protein Glove_151g6 [Diversispora epigaea]|uniref:TLDc domain-containing protein n=1 Tax=Diversispora epigaea TaxID=1348612 RepID=A0A397J1G0_9GLOM|nr:hypothetical protein Glove_151g6 [Diversispora epigaea]